MLNRAAETGYEAIMITVDTAVLGRRERDVRRGFTMPPRLGPATLLDGMLHPGWTWAFSRSDPITFANVSGHGGDAVSLSGYVAEQFDPSLSWADIEWFRANWSGPILIKGIQTVDDAELARDAGVDGIALSNHGGRQLDGAPAPIDLVAPVTDRVGDSLTVICDGGIRRGSDIVKAIALGADACMIGRAYLYALGAAGEPGVTWLLDNLREGVRRTMVLAGASSLSDLTPDLVVQRPGA
jgi:L-lactate dehydrogenase (cytochrome)